MTYQNTCIGKFLARPNRFIAQVEVNGVVETVHVKNTGRCRELLIPGVRVVLDKSNNPNRKTQYDLVAVWKGDRLINMDSQAPNQVFLEYLQEGRYRKDCTLIRPETTFGDSRFDFYLEAGTEKIFLEVKGVTLEENGAVLFPDAPTERGVKHIHELIKSRWADYQAGIVFVVQMAEASGFFPNWKTHAAFGEALQKAEQAGVTIMALTCHVTENSLSINNCIPICLEKPVKLPKT